VYLEIVVQGGFVPKMPRKKCRKRSPFALEISGRPTAFLLGKKIVNFEVFTENHPINNTVEGRVRIDFMNGSVAYCSHEFFLKYSFFC